MKITAYCLTTVLAILTLLTACREADDVTRPVHMTLTALIAEANLPTRTVYEDADAAGSVKVDWCKGDALWVCSTEDSRGFAFEYNEEQIEGSYWSYTDANFRNGEEVRAVFPADMMLSQTKAACNLDQQDGSLQGLDAYDLMASASAVMTDYHLTLHMQHQNAFVRIVLPKSLLSKDREDYDTGNIRFVLTGSENSRMNSVTYDLTTGTTTATGSSDYIEVNCTTAPLIDDQNCYYYVAVPAKTDLRQLTIWQIDQLLDVEWFENVDLEAGTISDIRIKN